LTKAVAGKEVPGPAKADGGGGGGIGELLDLEAEDAVSQEADIWSAADPGSSPSSDVGDGCGVAILESRTAWSFGLDG
jgi:hypothetical protein